MARWPHPALAPPSGGPSTPQSPVSRSAGWPWLSPFCTPLNGEGTRCHRHGWNVALECRRAVRRCLNPRPSQNCVFFSWSLSKRQLHPLCGPPCGPPPSLRGSQQGDSLWLQAPCAVAGDPAAWDRPAGGRLVRLLRGRVCSGLLPSTSYGAVRPSPAGGRRPSTSERLGRPHLGRAACRLRLLDGDP